MPNRFDMSIDKNIIITPELIRNDLNAVEKKLTWLQIYARHIPVAHFVFDKNDPEHSAYPTFRTLSNGKEEFFLDSYSDLFINNRHTGKEIAKLLKLYSYRLDKEAARKIHVWEWFIHQVPDETIGEIEPGTTPEQIAKRKMELAESKNHYKNFVYANMKLIDGFTRSTVLFLNGISLSDYKKTHKFASPYFTTRFRSTETDDDKNFLLPQDERIQNLIHTLSSFRNKDQHLDTSKFNAPTDADEEFIFCRNIHLGLTLYMFIIIDRFFDEFWVKLVKDEMTVDCNTIDETLLAMSKELLKLFYIKRVHKDAESRMRTLFHGTGIHSKEDLLTILPEILLTGTDDEGQTVSGDCVEMLVERQSNKRKLVVGNAGSGKTVMFLRMLQRDQPMATPFYFELKDFSFNGAGSPEEVVAHMNDVIEKTVIYDDNLIINQGVRNKTIERIHDLLDKGSAVFFIDSVDAALENLPNLLKFIDTYPECQYIVATQPDSVPSEFADAGFSTFEVQQLNDSQAKSLMRIVSMHLNDVDHTMMLDRKIRHLTSEMSRNPFTLMQIIYLFESGEKQMDGILNKAQLYWQLYCRIQTAPNLDHEERAELLNRSFLEKFLEKLDSVTELCCTVNATFNANPQGDWRTPILDFPMVKEGTPAVLKNMFELMEIVERRKVDIGPFSNIFRTLVTVAILEAHLHPDNSVNTLILGEDDTVSLSGNSDILPMPNPMLKVLAQATHATSFVYPKEKDYSRQQNGDSDTMIAYRLQPRYIIRQYILTLMNVYKKAGITMASGAKQLTDLFECIAFSGDKVLIDKLFTPYWMEKWLMIKDDEMISLGTCGSAQVKSPLRQILVENCVNPSYFLYCLIQQYPWIESWNMNKTRKAWTNTIWDVIVHQMNDEQREKLFNMMKLLKDKVDEDKVGYYSNLLIASMDNLWLAEKYDHTRKDTYKPELLQRLMYQGANPQALDILITWFAIMLEDGRQNELEETFLHLARLEPAMSYESRERFWTVIKDYLDIDKTKVRTIMNKIPIEDIDPDIAVSIYDPRILKYILEVKKREQDRLSEWKEFQTSSARRELYSTVTRQAYKKRSEIKYTFYCQTDSNTFIVATEGIDEMPEHRFCRITGYDQWFYVEDVIVIGKEKEMTHVAEMTINLPNVADRPRKGNLVMHDGKNIPYIHMFDNEASQQVVVRIDNADGIAWLSESGRKEFLKSNRHMTINGINAQIAGLDIREVTPDMRLVVIKSVVNADGNKDLHSATPKKIRTPLPHSGHLTFHTNKDMKEIGKRLYLKTPVPCNTATQKDIEASIYLGYHDEKHYMIAENVLKEGHVLFGYDSLDGAEVTRVVPMTGKQANGEVPAQILKQYEFFFNNSKSAAKKEGLSRNRFYNGSIIIAELKVRGQKKGNLFKPGKLIPGKAEICFYHPVFDPEPETWQPRKYAVELESCPARLTKVDDINVLELPKTNYPEKIRFFHSDVLPNRMPVNWYTPREESEHYVYIKVGDKIKALFTAEETYNITFYASSRDAGPMTVRFERLSDLVNLKRSGRYHPGITPILINEWVTEGFIDNDRYNFCKKKNYLAYLHSQCSYNNVVIAPEVIDAKQKETQKK